ncbi:MAG: alpha-2-macroglobulin family protein [Hyphomicrobiales bacterium]|nr:alpha-2-macroglobulin family protein [Hyphomicrobiales bacterium]MDE2115148.1 alpha-2-macroglobulin family protein [Hyphomicrobiales bacterium]
MRRLVRMIATLLLVLLSGGVCAAAPLAATPYINENLASEAVRLEAALAKATTDNPGTYLPGAESAKAIAAAPRNAVAWLQYSSDLASAVDRKSPQFYAYQNNSLAAAYIAYQRATNQREQASALQQIGAIYAGLQNWRPALNADLASLDLSENPALRGTYTQLRARYGFRILSFSVDNEVADPRACFQFSEALDSHHGDLAPFVGVDGMANAAISVAQSQICVEGLTHGQSYHIVLRKGIASNVRENLLADAPYQIYVRDRSPLAHFTGKNFILPRLGQQGIPVISVNTSKVALTVMRIADRSLLATVHSGNFLGQIDAYASRRLINANGIKVWSGTLDVASRLNADVSTAFPVTQAVGDMVPGLYVLLATPGEKPPSGTIDANADHQLATQWFVVSDLGLTAYSSPDGLHVLVRSLASAKALGKVSLRLVARSNEVLATATSGTDGLAQFDPGLSRGTGGLAPSLLVATDAGGDYNFVDLTAAPFDLTDRGVAGHSAPTGLDALVFPERGVYRSGETVHVTALLRDAKGEAVPALPIVLVIKRPDGVEYQRSISKDLGEGGHALDVALLSGAAVGTWNIDAYGDPKGPAIGHASFLVEDYVPDHLDMTLKAVSPLARLGQPFAIDTRTVYLYGAKGANLAINGKVRVEAADGPMLPSLKGYEFGLTDEPFDSTQSFLDAPVITDANGAAQVSMQIPDVSTPRALEAKISLNVAEPGGRAISRQLVVPIMPKTSVIGVAKDFGSAHLAEGDAAGFRIAVFDTHGQPVAQKSLNWVLYRMTDHFQYFRQNGASDYEKVTRTEKVASGTLDVTAEMPARISPQVSWGTYRLEVRGPDANLPPTAVSFEAGYGEATGTETPDVLKVTLDKDHYAASDNMLVHITARFAGVATLGISSDSFHVVKSLDLVRGDNLVSLPVRADWGSGAYLVAIEHRPLDVAAKLMPGRAIGVVWFGINQDDHRLVVHLAPPPSMVPRQTLDVPITLAGLKAGDKAFVTVAAVDVGILNLTQYRLPDAFEHVFGQRLLGTEIRDIYGKLIDGMQAMRGAYRSGGDETANVGGAAKPTQAPLALYSGPVAVDADGKAHISFAIPQFNGTLRLMATAWSQHAVGSTSADVIIRDPVVVSMNLPRFLNLHDSASLHVEVDNVAGAEGDYQVTLTSSGAVGIAPDAATHRLHLAKGARGEFDFRVSATGIGTALLALHSTGPDLDTSQTASLSVLPGTTELFHRFSQALAAGTSVRISNDLLADFVPGTGAVSVSVSTLGDIDIAALLQMLGNYPYRCSEQTVSRAMPLLDAGLVSLLPQGIDAAKRVNAAITRVLSRQDSTGAFGLWSAGGDKDIWLSAYVTDFLTRAKEVSDPVPPRALQSALDFLGNSVANIGQVNQTNSSGVAYAIYVLARNGRPVMGDLRYLTTTQMDAFREPLARAQLAASFALLGDSKGAAMIFSEAVKQLQAMQAQPAFDVEYASLLRDSAGVVTLAAESHAPDAIIESAAAVMRDANIAATSASTQEAAWMVRAGGSATEASRARRVEVNQTLHSGAFSSHFSAQALERAPVTIRNTGASATRIVVTTSGNPLVPEPSADNGYRVNRRLFTLDGQPLDAASITQNQRLVVVLDLVEPKAETAHVLLTDPLPAGLEIENPDILAGDNGAPLPFLSQQPQPAHAEYRDDRFIAAFDRDAGAGATYSIGYVVRAITPGHFVWPAATVEDMYRPNRYGRTATGTLDVVRGP